MTTRVRNLQPGQRFRLKRPGPAKSAAERMRRMRARRKNAAPSEGLGLDDLL